MSAADPSLPVERKFAPLQKWYLLFPENWAQLTFDRDWRTQRLNHLTQKQQAYRFWFMLGIVWFMVIVSAVGGHFDPSFRQSAAAPGIMLPVMVLSLLVYHAVLFVAAQVERIVLQVIDRLELEKTRT